MAEQNLTEAQKDSPTDLDFSLEAPLLEEESPYDAASEDRPLLFVQIVDDSWLPQAGLHYEVAGPGLPEPRQGETSSDGELLIEDCGAGVYQLTVGERSYRVHSLSRRDLETDGRAYRIVL